MRQQEKWLKKVQKKIHQIETLKQVECSMYQSSIYLKGTTASYEDVLKAGYIAAKSPFKEVINDIVAEDSEMSRIHVDKLNKIEANRLDTAYGEKCLLEHKGQTQTCDVLVIGAGIVGSSIARELSKYQLNVILVEKSYDVAVHTSSRNDGMVHPGIAAHANSLKCALNIKGNHMYHRISEELEVPIRWCGSLILFRSNWTKISKPYFWIKSKKIGMKGLKFLNQKQVYQAEPHLSKGVKWGVLCAESGVTSPYKMTVAYAENAIENGVELQLNTEVIYIKSERDQIQSVVTNRGVIQPKIVINAAGVYADYIAQMAGDRYYSIHPRKGEIVLFDKKKGHLINGILGFVSDRSSKNTKGGGIIKTYEGNLLVGPNAIETPDRDNYETHLETVKELLDQKLPQIEGMKREDDITYFTGIRAATYKEDFIIEGSTKVKNLIHVAGIQSPGFASAPAIAERVEHIAIEQLQSIQQAPVALKSNWNPKRHAIPDLANMSLQDRKVIIQNNPEYGDIICRCEEISRGEIVDALKSPIPVDTVDGIKRRVRAGMGRCQGGFCMPLVMEIIHEVKGIPMDEITKKSGQSKIVMKETKMGKDTNSSNR